MRRFRWGALVTVLELVGGVGLLAYGGWLVYEPLVYGIPGLILVFDAYIGGRT